MNSPNGLSDLSGLGFVDDEDTHRDLALLRAGLLRDASSDGSRPAPRPRSLPRSLAIARVRRRGWHPPGEGNEESCRLGPPEISEGHESGGDRPSRRERSARAVPESGAARSAADLSSLEYKKGSSSDRLDDLIRKATAPRDRKTSSIGSSSNFAKICLRCHGTVEGPQFSTCTCSEPQLPVE